MTLRLDWSPRQHAVAVRLLTLPDTGETARPWPSRVNPAAPAARAVQQAQPHPA
ncbi:hypothetical protein [Salinispora fenicalii]|uniref:hypothetical protein n=1 Tax=Salinispora fenicalii TaxID=1137263 RepID=UPI0004B2CFCF|nr:hypothetical protein [Salinispora fenicalii]